MPYGLKVECVTDAHELAQRTPAWRALQYEGTAGEWFAGPDWILPWLSHFGSTWSPAVHFVHRDGELLGVVPFCVRRHRTIGTPVFELPHNSHTRRIGWLAREGEADVLCAVFRFVRHSHPHASLGFPHIERQGHVERTLLAASSECGLRYHEVEQSRSATVDLAEGWEPYVVAREGRFLRNLRRHIRRLSEKDGWQVTLHTGLEDFEGAWAAVLEVERSSWKHAAGSSIPGETGAEPFYRAIAQQFAATDSLHLWLLHHQGKAVAHALAVRHGPTMYLLKNSFAEDVRSHSPGIALVWKSLEFAGATQCSVYDMLGDDEAWKLPLATHRPRYASWTLYPAHHVRGQFDGFSHRVARPIFRTLRERIQNRRKP